MRLVILLALLSPILSMCQPLSLNGKVLNENGEPVQAATITLRPVLRSTDPSTPGRQPHTLLTNPQGEFTLTGLHLGDTILVTAVGHERATEVYDMSLTRFPELTIVLHRKVGLLDETVIIAYGTTTRRLATGSVARITAAEISRQPVSNPLAALEGRVPGMVVVQSGGVPGAGFKVQIRGQASLAQGSDPLFIIDGVPYAPGNSTVNQLTSAANQPGNASRGGLSPFDAINPADIESIEVLKDADATAIYGASGASGVVLITTKKGQAGKTTVNLNLYSGFSRTTRTAHMLNTPQYLSMRREAFAADGATPNAYNAPDLLVWDTTRYTDFKKRLTGGTARTADAQLSVSGGTAQTKFLLGGGYHRETTVFPGNLSNRRGAFHASLQHLSADKRFSASLTAGYTAGDNRIVQRDLTSFINLPPVYPALYNAEGKLSWEQGGVVFNNPLAYLKYGYRAQTDNLTANLLLSYRLLHSLVLRASLGANTFGVEEHSSTPREAQNPLYNPVGTAEFGHSRQKSWIAEPQAEYTTPLGRGRLQLLLGTTWQEQNSSRTYISASGYSSDALLGSLAGAGNIYATGSSRVYRYTALFGRLNYNWQDRYVLNLSGRRDGSSRFGPGRQFAGFGAIGAAWIFSGERFVQQSLPGLSYGKLRGSYGTSGNDQIGDYQFLDSWTATNQPYAGTPGLRPVRLFNPDYAWERNTKWEGALELGFWQNRLLLSAAFFRNRSGNQLISYSLPVQTGFYSVTQNFDALVENRGWEFSLTGRLLESRDWTWTNTLNLTLPRNRLLSFPGLAASAYASTYVEGEPLSVIRGYRSTGVDPQTGVYRFLDADKDGFITYPNDYVLLGHRDPEFYGGLANHLRWKGWQMDLFFDYRRQLGLNYLAVIGSSFVPGMPYNQPVAVLARWQQPGDAAPLQKFTATPGSPAYLAAVLRLGASDAIYGNASFLRLRNLSLSWSLPEGWLRKKHIGSLRLYLQGQNLLTLTAYQGSDPETQNLYVLPPLRTLSAGLQLTF